MAGETALGRFADRADDRASKRRDALVRTVVVGGAAALTAYLALVPLGFLLWQSVHTTATTTRDASFTLDHLRAAWAAASTPGLVANSLAFATLTALFAFGVGTSLAFVNERTNVPLKRTFFALSIVPLVIPGVLFVVAWILLGSPKIGLLNLALQAAFRTDRVFIDVYTIGGMAFVEGLHYSPMAFLLMSAAFRALDPSLEEAALISGVRRRSVAYQITLKLAAPAAVATLLLLFVRALESFEVPALLGLPAGISVLTSQIYASVHRYPGDIGGGAAYAVVLVAITAAGVFFQSRFTARADRHGVVRGRAYRPRRLDLGGWRYPVFALVVVYFLLLIGLPFLVLLWSSFQPYYAVPSLAALANATLEPYRFVLEFPSISRATQNSIVLAVGTATLVMLSTSVVAWVVLRTRIRFRFALDHLASLPLVIPGVVLGLAMMIFYLHVDIGVYGTLWILFIAYATRFMPYGMRYANASMISIHRELEESAEVSGATWWATFRHIVLPLLRPGFVAGWIYIAIVTVRELSSSILLYSPGNEVLSVVIFELWENGQHGELSALGVLMTLTLLAIAMAAQPFAARVAKLG
jgi:iron(III) transport system permease protein